MQDLHYRKLEQMFIKAPVNQIFKNIHIEISERKCVLIWKVDSNFFHAGKSLHGAAYFKLLDDSAYFAAASLNGIHFIVTKSMHVQFLRHVTGGIIKAEGEVIKSEQGIIYATSVLRSQENKIVGIGEAEFSLSKLLLTDVVEYNL